MGSPEPLTDLWRGEEEKNRIEKKLETVNKKKKDTRRRRRRRNYKKSKKNWMVNVQLIGSKGSMLRWQSFQRDFYRFHGGVLRQNGSTPETFPSGSSSYLLPHLPVDMNKAHSVSEHSKSFKPFIFSWWVYETPRDNDIKENTNRFTMVNIYQAAVEGSVRIIIHQPLMDFPFFLFFFVYELFRPFSEEGLHLQFQTIFQLRLIKWSIG